MSPVSLNALLNCSTPRTRENLNLGRPYVEKPAGCHLAAMSPGLEKASRPAYFSGNDCPRHAQKVAQKVAQSLFPQKARNACKVRLAARVESQRPLSGPRQPRDQTRSRTGGQRMPGFRAGL